ncbi:MAG TPA: redoxin domain-containing protein, partial [Tianweitania sediminis]|nr:redoxin domain-containing protein [Tianweitania sediminis]
TELGTMAGLEGEFAKRNVKIIGISVDPVESHGQWKQDIQTATGYAVEYPLIGDKNLEVAKLYDMLPAEAGSSSEGRTPADNATVRSVYVIGPDKKIKLILTYPMTTGRNFDEILRAIDSIQLTAKHKVATPANWKNGDDVIITAAVSDEEANEKFGSFERVLPYLRKTRQPSA